MCSSGIRLGAWDYLRWQDVFPIIKDGEAARLTIYAGEDDQYYAYCTCSFILSPELSSYESAVVNDL
jgi:hypothetical protein